MDNVSRNSFSRELYTIGANFESTTKKAFKEILKPISKIVNPNLEKLQEDIYRYDHFNKYLDNMYKDTGAKSINYQA